MDRPTIGLLCSIDLIRLQELEISANNIVWAIALARCIMIHYLLTFSTLPFTFTLASTSILLLLFLILLHLLFVLREFYYQRKI